MFVFVIQCQIGIYFIGVLDGGFQFDIFVINDLNYVFFINIIDVNGVCGIISYQFMWLQWVYFFCVFMIIQYQMVFYFVCFGIYCCDCVVYGVIKL